jgi:hypothetical protein
MSPNERVTQFQSTTRKEGEVLKIEDNALVTALKDRFKMMVEAIVKTDADDDTLRGGLWDALMAIKRYGYGHVAHHYAYHVHNLETANAFLPLTIGIWPRPLDR